MDVIKRLNTVKTFKQYKKVSEDVASKSNSLQNVEFNMSTIIALKNVQSFEIEVSFSLKELNHFSCAFNYKKTFIAVFQQMR